MKTLLTIAAISFLLVSCSSNEKKTMMKDKMDQTVKAAEEVKTKAEMMTKEATMPTADSIMRTECKLGKDMRVIAIDKNGANGCLVNYTKNGDSKQVARSQVGHTYCKEVATRIQSNLSNAGFACQ